MPLWVTKNARWSEDGWRVRKVPDVARWSHMIPNDLRWSQMARDCPRQSQMLSDGPTWMYHLFTWALVSEPGLLELPFSEIPCRTWFGFQIRCVLEKRWVYNHEEKWRSVAGWSLDKHEEYVFQKRVLHTTLEIIKNIEEQTPFRDTNGTQLSPWASWIVSGYSIQVLPRRIANTNRHLFIPTSFPSQHKSTSSHTNPSQPTQINIFSYLPPPFPQPTQINISWIVRAHCRNFYGIQWTQMVGKQFGDGKAWAKNISHYRRPVRFMCTQVSRETAGGPH